LSFSRVQDSLARAPASRTRYGPSGVGSCAMASIAAASAVESPGGYSRH
jgi:hypothetical protein